MSGQFGYRGFMLDASRHFMPAADVCRLLDGAALCGMNRMHWHLTDDQGWRIEIRKYPRLTEIGSRRGETFFGGVSRTENNNGFYTQEEIRGVVAYAEKKGVAVIPEIEIPGHASAMLAAYPEFGCRRDGAEGGRTYAVQASGGIFPNLVCAGKPEAVRFLEDILDEVTELFPFPMVHIGGDEALKLHWRRCPDCRDRMRREGLADEDALQRALVLEIGEYLKSKGRETIVWNDVLDGGGLPDHFIVQHWRGGEEETRAFMENGGRVIVSDNAAYYMDYPYGRTDVRRICEYPRIPAYAEGLKDRVLGLECPLWTERVTNPERAAYLLFPRMAAVGLKAATSAEIPWERFRGMVRELAPLLEAAGLKGAPEEMWDMSPEAAEKDRQADHDRMYAPEAMPYLLESERLVRLDREEKESGQFDPSFS